MMDCHLPVHLSDLFIKALLKAAMMSHFFVSSVTSRVPLHNKGLLKG